MGNFLSNSKRKIIKPFKNYNIDSRVEKIIKKSKPNIAPRHEVVTDKIPIILSQSLTKDKLSNSIADREMNSMLMKNLENVYVTSEKNNPEFKKNHLVGKPLNREFFPTKEYGYFEPKKVKYGKITLQDALQILTTYQEQRDDVTPQTLALKYNVDSEKLEKVLKYFYTFSLVVPNKVHKFLNHDMIGKLSPGGTSSTVLLNEPDVDENEKINRRELKKLEELRKSDSNVTNNNPKT